MVSDRPGKKHFGGSLMQRHNILAFIIIATLIILCQGISSAALDRSERDRVLTHMKEREKSLNTLTATFVQVKSTRLLKEPLRSQGMIYYRAPGTMLCKILDPSQVTILFKNRLFLIYYPDTGKRRERYLGNNILKELFGMGKPMEEFERHYTITVGSIGDDGTYHMKLIPRQARMASRIETIEMDITPDQWLPHRIELREKNGDVTSIRLAYTSINEPLEADVFRVEPSDDHEGPENEK
jgi:outer membrane lipoprotein-sorting protein